MNATRKLTRLVTAGDAAYVRVCADLRWPEATALTSYISEGLRRDEAQVESYTTQHLSKALKRRGVKEKVLLEAIAEVRGQYVIDQRKAK